MHFIKTFLLPFVFLAVTFLAGYSLLWASSGEPSSKEKMLPHKALYAIEMVSKRSGSQIINISGEMFYELHSGCDGWTTDHRFNLLYEYADTPPIRITSYFSTYETFDGKSFDYTSNRKRNGELYQEFRGRAEMKNDKTGTARYTTPEDLVFNLKKDSLFPMAHSLDILKFAQEGKKFYNATIFDGSDEEGPVEVNAFIGTSVNAMALIKERPEIDTTLLNTPAWNVRMAFFPLIDESADAEYEMNVIFHDNGVISDMLVEYNDFSVTQKLIALEKREPENCKK